MKRTPIQRYTPLRKRRTGVRRGQPTKAEKTAMREMIYQLSGGRCELNLDGCNRSLLPSEGSVFERWHLVHMRAKRRFGWPTSGPDRMRGGCYHCHIEMMHGKGIKPNTERNKENGNG